MKLQVCPLKGPLLLENCDELRPLIKKTLMGWTVSPWPKGDKTPPLITITKTAKGYRRTSPWVKSGTVFKHPVDAVCDFYVDLSKAYLSQNPHLIFLHCAAATFGENLILFPSTYRAGKSTLAAALAHAGARLFAEDVMALDPATMHGVAFGIQPRLRNPLPDDFSSDLIDFIDAHTGPKSDRYRYLTLDDDALSPFAATAPISRIMVLDRDPDRTEVSETPVETGEILKRIILRNFAHTLPAETVLSTLTALAEQCPSTMLHYPNAQAATRYLKALPDDRPAASPIVGGDETPRADMPFDGPDNGDIVKSPHITERPVGDNVFLVGPDGDDLYCLEGLGVALWRSLDEPATPEDAIHLFKDAFPDVDPVVIEKDIRRILGDLARRQLILTSP